jgi:DNA-directed RNA polymerase subunit M/transcription elongation factor TFIIS
MRWRPTFMTEVMGSIQRLGLRACPVCGSSESLTMGHSPVFLVDGETPPDDDAPARHEHDDGELTFAVRVECSTCGHLMLFNALRHRTADDKILIPGPAEGEGHIGPLPGQP